MICYLLLLVRSTGEGLSHSRACLIGQNERDVASVFCRIRRDCKIKVHNISIKICILSTVQSRTLCCFNALVIRNIHLLCH